MYVTPTQIQYVDFPCLVLELFILEGHTEASNVTRKGL